MEGNFQQTSFIPKKPMVDPTVRQPHRTSFFSLVMGVIFVTVLALSGGVFAYKYITQRSIESTKMELDSELAKFEPAVVAELARLDQRIETSKQLLNQHVSLSSFFAYLGEHTLRNVRFSSFALASTPTGPAITMAGQATGFSTVALQASEFAKPEIQNFIKQSSLSDLNLDPSGNVSFSYKGQINPTGFLYSATVKGSDIVLPPVATTTATSTSNR